MSEPLSTSDWEAFLQEMSQNPLLPELTWDDDCTAIGEDQPGNGTWMNKTSARPPSPDWLSSLVDINPKLDSSSSKSVCEPQSSSSTNTSPARFACEHDACPKTFARHSDMLRHLRGHGENATYDCPVVTCKFRGKQAKTRKDKFVDHLRRGHREGATFTCPLPRCVQDVYGFGDFGVHIQSHVFDHSELKTTLESAASTKARKCPMSNCTYRRAVEKISQHLQLKHDSLARSDQADNIATAGFDWETCSLVCPLCSLGSAHYPDIKVLHEHLEEIHISLSGSNLPLFLYEKRVNYPRAKRLGLLRDSESLMAQREQILAVYPDIWSHPVFDDLRAQDWVDYQADKAEEEKKIEQDEARLAEIEIGSDERRFLYQNLEGCKHRWL